MNKHARNIAFAAVVAFSVTACSTAPTVSSTTNAVGAYVNYQDFVKTFDPTIIKDETDRAIIVTAIQDINALLDAVHVDSNSPANALASLTSVPELYNQAVASITRAQGVYERYRPDVPVTDRAKYDVLNAQITMLIRDLQRTPTDDRMAMALNLATAVSTFLKAL